MTSHPNTFSDAAHRRHVRQAAIVIAIVCGVALTIGTAAALVGLQFPVTEPRPGVLSQTERLFSPDGEGNVLSWLSSTLMAALAALFVALAVMSTQAQRRAFVFFAVIAAVMSFDEAVQIHEYLFLVADRLNISSPLTWAWLVVGIPLAAAVGVLAVVAARALPRFVRGRLMVAGSLFLGGALGVEAIGGLERRLDYTDNELLADSINIGLIGLEEGLEFAGVILAIATLLACLRVETSRGSVRISAHPALAQPGDAPSERLVT